MRALNEAEVALFPVDPRGLTTARMLDPAFVTDCTLITDNFTWPTMDTFAQRTGGVPFYGRNDLEAGVRSAMEDVETGYTLGFYVRKEGEPGGFHKLTVRSLRPGVKLRYKEGYYAGANGS